MLGDLEVLKEIPGYKAILKSVLKSQIQMLVEQLSEHTGEETILLTASLHDGTLSHQGSTTGKGFLEGRDEIKSQFLGYCLKSHHKKKSTDTRPSPYQRPQTSGRISPALGSPSKKAPRLQVQPVSLQRVVPAENTGTPNSNKRPADVQGAPSQVFTSDSSAEQSSVSVKLESNESGVSSGDSENLTTTATFPSSIHQNHTLTAGEISASENNDSQNNADDYTEISTMNDDSSTANTCIKIEPITENEMELEITGVEPGKVSMQSDSWSHSPSGFGITPTSVVEASSFSNETNDSSYNQARYPVSLQALVTPHSDARPSSINKLGSSSLEAVRNKPINLSTFSETCSSKPEIVGKLTRHIPASNDCVEDASSSEIVNMYHERQSAIGEMLAKFSSPEFDMNHPETISTVSELGTGTSEPVHNNSESLSAYSEVRIPKIEGSYSENASTFGTAGVTKMMGNESRNKPLFYNNHNPYSTEKNGIWNQWNNHSLSKISEGKCWKCDKCDKWFSKNTDVNRHNLIHSGDKPFKCSMCEKTFNRKSNMQSHMMTHYKSDLDQVIMN